MTGREVVSSLFLARKRFCNTKKLEKVNKPSYTQGLPKFDPSKN